MLHRLNKPLIKSILSAVAAAIVILIIRATASIDKSIHFWVLVACGWLAFALVYMALTWAVIIRSSAEEVDEMADVEDGSIAFVFVMVLLASLASLGGVLNLVSNKDEMQLHPAVFVGLSIGTLIISWAMVHTLYTMHYARLYYRDDKGGFEFADGDDYKPDYRDFAYIAFGIGATFQVADTDIDRPECRRVVMVHSLISFALNTFAVALTINIIAGMMK